MSRLTTRELELFRILVKSSPGEDKVTSDFSWMGSETGKEDFRVEKTFKSLIRKEALQVEGRTTYYVLEAARSLCPECLPVDDDPVDDDDEYGDPETQPHYSDPNPQDGDFTDRSPAPQHERTAAPSGLARATPNILSRKSKAPPRRPVRPRRTESAGHVRIRCSYRVDIREAVRFFNQNLIAMRKCLTRDVYPDAALCLIDAQEALDHPQFTEHPRAGHFHARFQSACLLMNALK